MPDPDPLAALAMTGATTLVTAMATSAWETARTRTAALFHRRGDSRREVEAQLERSAARVARTADSTVRDGEVSRWRNDLADLLREQPGTADALHALVRDLQQQLPPVQQQLVQQVTARDGGAAYGAQGSGSSVTVHYHHPGAASLPPAPGPADPR